MNIKWKKSINKIVSVLIIIGFAFSDTSPLVRAIDSDNEQAEAVGDESSNQVTESATTEEITEAKTIVADTQNIANGDNFAGIIPFVTNQYSITYYNGYYMGIDLVEDVAFYDLTTSLSFYFTGSSTFGGGRSYRVEGDTGIIISETYYTEGDIIDFSGLPNGKYLVTLRAYKTNGIDFDTGTISLNIQRVTTEVDVSSPINPDNVTISTDRADASSVLWELRDENDMVVASGDKSTLSDVSNGIGKAFDSDYLNALENGNYTISIISTITTEYGNTVTDSSSEIFMIRHPQSTTQVDKPINPESITGTKKIEESTLTWEIKNADGDVILSGIGDSVPTADIEALEEGSYTVEFTETSPEEEVSISKGSFIIRHPQSTTQVDKPINPENITGTKKIEESTLTWEIKNAEGDVILSGIGDSVPTADIEALEEGSYSVEFTETSPEEEVSITDGSFMIRHPQSTTQVDKPINPENITGTKKIEESTLTWEIKNADGEVIVSGTGNSVPEADIESLEEGSYTVEFTETSPEEEVSLSEGSFLIRHPQSTTNVDKPINPENITGTKKIEESTLTWEIKNADGEVILSGIGDSVPTADIEALEEGSYTVEFTETSPENEVSVSSGTFIIKTETTDSNSNSIEETTSPSSSPETSDHTQICFVIIYLISSLLMLGIIAVSKINFKIKNKWL